MTDELITFETAKLAKEAGYCIVNEQAYNFNGERCSSFLADAFYPCPTQTTLARWLFEKFEIKIDYCDEMDTMLALLCRIVIERRKK